MNKNTGTFDTHPPKEKSSAQSKRRIELKGVISKDHHDLECDAEPYHDQNDSVRVDNRNSVIHRPPNSKNAERPFHFTGERQCPDCGGVCYSNNPPISIFEFRMPLAVVGYDKYENRLETFKDKWPKYLAGPTPEALARSGFFYMGEGDKVQCFSCGKRLYQWEPADSADIEHIRWSPHCQFLPLVAPEEYGYDE